MKAHSIFLTAALVVVSAAGLLALDACQPDCYDHEEGDKVADPYNCTQYYICVHEGQPSDHAVACDPGDVFDPTTSECITSETCETECIPSDCDSKCTASMDLIQDPLDCNAYYLCNAQLDTEGPFYCPDDRPYFDGDECISDSFRCCYGLCIPYCHPSDVQIIDPKDCSKYYLCTAEGPATEDTHFPCPSGETFQISSGKCLADVPCVTLCP